LARKHVDVNTLVWHLQFVRTFFALTLLPLWLHARFAYICNSTVCKLLCVRLHDEVSCNDQQLRTK